MRAIYFILPLFIVSCTNVVIYDNQSYDKNKQTSSSVNCWGYCIEPSSNGKTCISYADDISQKCKRYFENAE